MQTDTIPSLLRQHRDTPILWHTCSDKTFKKAAERNRPLFISIGYFGSLECDKMALTCFNHSEIAPFLNSHFICIAVDAQERPDISHYYEALFFILHRKKSTGPLLIFCTSHNEPFYASNRMPPFTHNRHLGFMNLLQTIVQKSATHDEELFKNAKEIADFMQQQHRNQKATLLSLKIANTLCHQASARLDKECGGFQESPKRAETSLLRTLMLLHSTDALKKELSKQNAALCTSMITHSLDAYIQGGLYDLLHSGFYTYSTDSCYAHPSSAKRTDDNAALITLYADAATIFNSATYAEIAKDCAQFLRNTLFQDGLFYSGFNANNAFNLKVLNSPSSVIEGVHELTLSTLQKYLSPKQLACLEIPNHCANNEKIALRFKERYAHESINEIRQTLQPILQPFSDASIEKQILLSANALMVRAFCALSHHDAIYAKYAIETFDALIDTLYQNRVPMHHLPREHESITAAFLDDYCFLADAHIAMFQLTSKALYLHEAQHLMQQVIERFYSHGKLYFSQAPYETEASMDEQPHMSAIACFIENLLTLDALTPHFYRGIAFTTLQYYSAALMHAPITYPALSAATLRFLLQR